MQIPPYDFMQADEMLSEEALSEVQKESYRWMAEGFVALMPRSCCVLDSVRIEDVPSHGLYSDVLEPFSLPSEPPKKVRSFLALLRGCTCAWLGEEAL